MNIWLHTLKFALYGREESATCPDCFYHGQTADRSQWTENWMSPRSGLDGAANREIVTAAVNETLIISVRAIKHRQTVMQRDHSTTVRCRQSHPIYIQNTGHAACDGETVSTRAPHYEGSKNNGVLLGIHVGLHGLHACLFSYWFFKFPIGRNRRLKADSS